MATVAARFGSDLAGLTWPAEHPVLEPNPGCSSRVEVPGRADTEGPALVFIPSHAQKISLVILSAVVSSRGSEARPVISTVGS